MDNQISTEVSQGIDAYYARSGSIVVTTAEQRSTVMQDRKTVKEFKAAVCAVYDPHIEAAHKTHKGLCNSKKALTDKCDAFERNAGYAVMKFDEAERQRAEAEQRRLQAEEDARVAKERERLEKKAESMKTEAKKQEYQEAAAAVQPSTVTVGPAYQKEEGERSRTTWKARIIDIAKIRPAIYLKDEKVVAAIQSRMNEVARANKGTMPVEGVEFYKETKSSI